MGLTGPKWFRRDPSKQGRLPDLRMLKSLNWAFNQLADNDNVADNYVMIANLGNCDVAYA